MEVIFRIRCMRGVDRASLLLTGDIYGSVKLWDIKCGKLVRDLERFHDRVLCLDICQLQSAPGEEPVFLAAGGSEDRTAKVRCMLT
jgi:WD40 repeat protein